MHGGYFMAAIGGGSPQEYLAGVVQSYEAKQAKLQDLTKRVKELDTKIASLGPLKRIASNKEKKALQNEINQIITELQEGKISYNTAKRNYEAAKQFFNPK